MIGKEEVTYDDVLLLPQHSSLESRLEPVTDITILEKTIAPIIVANMETTGIAAVAKAVDKYKVIVPIHRFCSIESQINEIKEVKESCKYSAATLGIRDNVRRDAVLDLSPDFIFVDLAHADTCAVLSEVEYIRSKIRDTQVLVVGNVVTKPATRRLQSAGANVVKIGIGSGSICSTRLITGCGRPQLSAVCECASVGIDIIADGGIKHPGDIVKALAGGASFVMLGRMYGGTTEAYGQYGLNGQKMYRGLASKEAQEAFTGAMRPELVPEGIQTVIPNQGSAEDVTIGLLAALRQGMSMLGAHTIDELQESAWFIRTSSATVLENNAR